MQVCNSVRKVNCQGVVYDGTGYKHRDAGQKPNSQFVEAICELWVYSFSRITPYFYFIFAYDPALLLSWLFDFTCPNLKEGNFPTDMSAINKFMCNMMANLFDPASYIVQMTIFYPLPPFLILYYLKPSTKAGRALCALYLWFVYLHTTTPKMVSTPFIYANYVILYLVFMLKSPRHKILVMLFTVFPFGIMVMTDPSVIPKSVDNPYNRIKYKFDLFNNDSRPVLGLITNDDNLPVSAKRRFKIMEPTFQNSTVVESVKKRFEKQLQELKANRKRKKSKLEHTSDTHTRNSSDHVVGKLNVTEVTGQLNSPVVLNITEVFTEPTIVESTTRLETTPVSTTDLSVVTPDIRNPYETKDGVVIQNYDPAEKVGVMDEVYIKPAKRRISYRVHPRT